jgi:hypothetical protein
MAKQNRNASNPGRSSDSRRETSSSGGMSVREAGQKGGQKVRELIERGKQATSERE